MAKPGPPARVLPPELWEIVEKHVPSLSLAAGAKKMNELLAERNELPVTLHWYKKWYTIRRKRQRAAATPAATPSLNWPTEAVAAAPAEKQGRAAETTGGGPGGDTPAQSRVHVSTGAAYGLALSPHNSPRVAASIVMEVDSPVSAAPLANGAESQRTDACMPTPCDACEALVRRTRTTAHFAVADDLPEDFTPEALLEAALCRLRVVCKGCYKARENGMRERTGRWCTLVLRYDNRGEPVAALLRGVTRPNSRDLASRVGDLAKKKQDSSPVPNVVQGGRWQAQPAAGRSKFGDAFDAMEEEQRPYQVSAPMQCLPYKRRTRFAPRSLAGAAVRFAAQVVIRPIHRERAELASSRSHRRDWPGEGAVASLGPLRRTSVPAADVSTWRGRHAFDLRHPRCRRAAVLPRACDG